MNSFMPLALIALALGPRPAWAARRLDPASPLEAEAHVTAQAWREALSILSREGRRDAGPSGERRSLGYRKSPPGLLSLDGSIELPAGPAGPGDSVSVLETSRGLLDGRPAGVSRLLRFDRATGEFQGGTEQVDSRLADGALAAAPAASLRALSPASRDDSRLALAIRDGWISRLARFKSYRASRGWSGRIGRFIGRALGFGRR